MKCPSCGQWNRNSNPHCIACGAPLVEEGASGRPVWRGKIKDDARGAAYYRMDENGESAAEADARDQLAQEMADLKTRKRQGTERQRRFFADAANRGSAPSGLDIRVSGETNSYWQTQDDPYTAMRKRREEAARSQGSRTAVESDTVSQEEIGWDDTRTFDPLWAEQEAYASRWQKPDPSAFVPRLPARQRFLRKLLRATLTLLALGVVGLCVFFGYHYFEDRQIQAREARRATVVPSMLDDLAAHTIMIPGEEGAQIYIRELHSSYIVTDGYASIDVADHTWYDDLDNLRDESMDVTLTPFLKSSSGRQVPMDPITYTIYIPLSPIELITPDGLRETVSSTMYTIKFNVRPGSIVTINNKDVSDMVNNDSGDVSFNATVQPSGDNLYEIICRSQYCRENVMTVVLYREPQEIPLDLAADTYTSTSLKYMQVNCTTLPGATVDILSPHSDLNITNLNTTGAFSFYATFDHIGDNMIQITASYPGNKTSLVEYKVHYVPPVGEYSATAWSLNNPSDYAELVSNITYRAEHTQVYVLTGFVSSFVSEKPQSAIFFLSADGKSQPVRVTNVSKTTWVKDQFYRIYADVYGTYDGMPWLNARFTYTY